MAEVEAEAEGSQLHNPQVAGQQQETQQYNVLLAERRAITQATMATLRLARSVKRLTSICLATVLA